MNISNILNKTFLIIIMMYHKSKFDYFYKVIENEEYKSVKGGKIEEDGILDKNNFSQKIEIHPRKNRTNNDMIELTRFNNVKYNNNINISSIPNPKIMIKSGFRKEPYIFFGYNHKTGKYRYVCYNDLRIFHTEIHPFDSAINSNYKKKVICKELKEDGTIVEVKFLDSVPFTILVHLYIFLLEKREQNRKFMERLYDYLWHIIYYKITKRQQKDVHLSPRVLNTDMNFDFLKGYYDKNNLIRQFINTSE